ncbi:STIV orfB116 family protein [Aquifex sp.]
MRLLGIEIEANRIPIKLSEGDVLIVFQLLERLPEGKVLSEEELKKLKYKFYKVEILV